MKTLLTAIWLVVLLVAAVLSGSKLSVKKIQPLDSSSWTWPNDSFREGAFFADASEIPPGLETRGSRVDGVEYQGTFTSGWFSARPRVTLLVAGFPQMKNNALTLEVRDADGHLTSQSFNQVNPRDCWRPWTVALPPGATAFRIHAVDGESGTDGWLAFSEPFAPRLVPALLPQTARTLLAFALQAVLFTTIGIAVVMGLRLARYELGEPSLVVLVAGAGVAVLGYAAFWAYFAHPIAGRIFSWSVCLAGCVVPLLQRRSIPDGRKWLQPVLLAATIGLFYLALLLLFEPSRFSFAAANRFTESLPSDNEIPRAFAERLWKGESPRQLWGDWLSSDRPPLQSGWLLLSWPVLHAFGFDLDTATGTGGVCFQLLWVLATCALAQYLGASVRTALAVTAAISFSGVLMVFSVFVWPKLAAAALVVAAYLLWFDDRTAGKSRLRFALGGGCAALGWLAHGGVAFSLLGVVPLALARRRQIGWRRWLVAAAAFAICAAPWFAYQHLYEPPGNRLLKWHLAGAIEIDSRGVLETLRDSYRNTGLKTVLANKWSNLRLQVGGEWARMPHAFFRGDLTDLRIGETTYTAHAWGGWIIAWLLPLAWLFRVGRIPPTLPLKAVRMATAWLTFGMVAWLLLMFLPSSAIIHQGTLVTQLLSLSLLATWALHFDRHLFVGLAMMQAGWFLAIWAPRSGAVEGKLQVLPAGIAALSGGVLCWLIWRAVPRSGAVAQSA